MLLRGKCIFIVEDNIGNASIMKTALELYGATTYLDRWGKDTINRLQQLKQVDLILMDLMLPGGMSGYDIYEDIKGVPELAAIRTVVVTASEAAVEMERARSRGFCGYISKPIQYAVFAQMIARILNGEEVWNEHGHD